MELSKIVEEWLRSENYDGLYNASHCACEVDDLMPCEEPGRECMAGYKIEFDGESPCEEGCRWHIGPKRKTES